VVGAKKKIGHHVAVENKIKKMRKSTPAIPPQLRCILQTEGRSTDPQVCIRNIQQAKDNELQSYLSLCEIRVMPSDSTSKPPA